MTNIQWILMPVRNNLHLTQRAVKSCLKQDYGLPRVLLIDNASQDGTREWARSMYPSVIYLRKDPPLSVAESWNKGLSLLFDGTSNQYVLVVNNDIELRPETYRMLLQDDAEFVTAVGCDDRGCLLAPNHPPHTKRPNPDFSCFLMCRSVWEKVGQFDEKFKGAFAEDWDYHVRLHKAGITAYSLGIPFYHVGSATIKSMDATQADLLCKQADLNRAYFKVKWNMEGGSKEYEEFFRTPAGGH